ncbi:efflux RND transporter periplasmic adaptor subunit [bacterium]|nr:efflux RND transporter periplasmic adaptor subunit [bacterium]
MFHRHTRIARPLVALTFLLAGLLAAGCGEDAQTAGGKAGGPGAGRGPGGRPDLPPAPVALAEISRGPIASYYRATASLEAEKTVEVAARVEGLVGELLAEEGDRVTAGQTLLVIDNPALTYRLEQAAAQTAQLRSAYERLEQMHAEDLASAEELEVARAAYDDAAATEGLARLDVEYTRVAAPFDGVVTRRLVDVGQTLTVGQALFELADVTPLRARVHVPSRQFRELAIDQSVELVLDSDGTVLIGTITLISPIIDATSGTIKVTVELPEYPVGTRPGDFAEVRIVTEMRDRAVLVPRTAVVTEKGESFIYVATPGEDGAGPVATRRLVEVGFTDDDHAQLLSGGEPGEHVVVKGQRSLAPGQPLRVLEGPGAGSAGTDDAGRAAGTT